MIIPILNSSLQLKKMYNWDFSNALSYRILSYQVDICSLMFDIYCWQFSQLRRYFPDTNPSHLDWMTCAHKCIRQVNVRNLVVLGLGFKRKVKGKRTVSTGYCSNFSRTYWLRAKIIISYTDTLLIFKINTPEWIVWLHRIIIKSSSRGRGKGLYLVWPTICPKLLEPIFK